MPTSALSPLELCLEAGDDRLAVGLVLLGLGVIAADNVAVFTDLDLFDPQLSFTALALENERNHRCRVIEHDVVDHAARAFAGPQNVFHAQLFERGDGIGADHAAIGDNAGACDAEARSQPIDHRQQDGHVSGVAGYHLGADRPALGINDQRQDHLRGFGWQGTAKR